MEWVADCLVWLRRHDLDRIEATEDEEDAWVEHTIAVGDETLYPLANSWYVGANIPGKPRVFTPYVGGFDTYRRILATGLPATATTHSISDVSNPAHEGWWCLWRDSNPHFRMESRF